VKHQIQRWIKLLKRDKQRAGLMMGLAAVGMLLWGRLLLKQVPQTASADDKPAWLADAEAEVGKSLVGLREVVSLVKPSNPDRDPFLLDPNRYKPLLSEGDLLNGAKLDEELTDEAKRMLVVNTAKGLRLQSITLGEVPAVFINGRLIRLGGSIEGFELLNCNERSVVLVKHGVKVRLSMNSAKNRNR